MFILRFQICMELKNTSNNWKTFWDSESQTPFAISGSKVIAYDNEPSITEKVRFAMEKGLAGAMVWSIDTDDFHGDCSENEEGFTNFPLMKCINKSIEQALKDIENAIIHGNSARDGGSATLSRTSYIVLCLIGLLVALFKWSIWA